MSNRTCLRAASLVSHPLSIAAMLLLLFNDHWWRWDAPSWWTGKLGDFAWLFFAPFVAALLLALIVPPSPRQEKIVRVSAFGLVGGLFALAKTVPSVHACVVQIGEMILGVPIGLRRDPTDLIALASLGAAWWLWDHHTDDARARLAPGVIALGLAAMLTLANGPKPDYGITELQLSGDAIIARSTWGAWASRDGGMTWTSVPTQGTKDPGLIPRSAIITDTVNANVLYRVAPQSPIERSEDGGKTWRIDFVLTPLSEAAQIYANSQQRYGFTRGPVGGIVDPRSGNVIFAMAHEGVLVRKPSGEYVWVAVGPHHRVTLDDPMALLSSELLVAFSLGLLVLATLTTRALPIRHWSKHLFVAVGWLVWLVDYVFFPPLQTNAGYAGIVAYFAAIGTLIVAGLITLIVVLIGKWRALRLIGARYLIALIAVPLFFAPFYLWTLDLIPRYTIARVIAFTLGAVTMSVGWWISNRKVEKL